MVLGQSVMADQGGHYVPRAKDADNAEAYVASMRVNQQTGLIDPAWMIQSAKQDQAIRGAKDESQVYWVSMGPDNLGGRTTCIVYDNENPNEVYIGSMGGGVFRTWNQGITWHQISDNLMVSCMVQAKDGTLYVGTGDTHNAQSYNLLGDYGDGNSYLGSGLYTVKKVNGRFVTEPVPTAQPTGENEESEWSFINDLAIDGDLLIAATNDGLRYTNDGCATWQFAVDTAGAELNERADEVFVAKDHSILASVKGKLYLGQLDGMICKSARLNQTDEDGNIILIAQSADVLDVAVSPTDPNVLYAATINVSGQHSSIYTSSNKGETWHVVLPSVNTLFGHNVYESRGLLNHGLVIDPENTDWVYICAYNLWRLERTASDPDGYYIAMKMSDGNTTAMNDGTHRYLHVGVNQIAFDPRDAKKAYVATDGGIFKAADVPNSIYLAFSNCNRGYVSAHCLNVAPSGKASRVVAGLLDHGPILIEGDENADHMGTAVTLMPNSSASNFGLFEESYHAGNCAVSTINPNAFIFSTKNGNLKRTETAGADYDISNFTSGQSFTGFTGYSLPFALYENYNDPYNLDSVWYYGKKGDKAGDTVQCYSNINDHPFDFVLPYDMTEHDSIQVHDPITARLYVGLKDYLYMTREPLRFNVVPKWYRIDNKVFKGIPSCITVSADGDALFVGTRNGRLARFTNLSHAIDAATSTMNNANFAIQTKAITLTGNKQTVTSISINPNDANKVVLTLGNYGNDQYVLYSNNALSDDPTFESVQGNLPLMPVYSSVVVMKNGYVMVGTDRGVWMTKDIEANEVVWEPAQGNMGVVPVMDLKQQVLYHKDQIIETVLDSVTIQTVVPGVKNQGIIYAATYGRGLFRCENFRMEEYLSVNEGVAQASPVSMYPNPVRDNAYVRFSMTESATVNYQVFDMMGRVVRNASLGTLSEGEHNEKIAVEGLSAGTYLLRLNAGSHTSTVKFMVY